MRIGKEIYLENSEKISGKVQRSHKKCFCTGKGAKRREFVEWVVKRIRGLGEKSST